MSTKGKRDRGYSKLTTNTDETDIASLFAGDTVFSIPYFQRAYKWKPDKLEQLEKDILSIVDSDDSHFVGAIIVHGRKSNPADPNVYEVIDGQQRLTTFYLYIAAAIKTLAINKEYDEATGLFLKCLVINRPTKLISNFRLHSCKEDRSQLNSVFDDLLSIKAFKEALKFEMVSLPATGDIKGIIKNNYKAALRFFSKQMDEGGIQRIRDIYEAILSKMTIVQIDVWDPTNGPKIFDSLNSKQEPMTIGDLVRNEIFRKVANQAPEVVEEIDQKHWQPFYKKFKDSGPNQFDNYFFPFGLIKNSNIKKSEVYSDLRETWEKNELDHPEKIIKELAEYQNAFIDITTGSNSQGHTSKISKKFKDLHKTELPSSTYPFLMQLSNSICQNKIAESEGLEILKVIESFLVRRALCGYEPTGLHAVFKRLWADCGDSPTAQSTIENIRKHKTVTWPDDTEVMKAIKERPLYNTGICSYFILKNNESYGGDIPDNIPWIEHILPDKPDRKWYDSFTKEEHEAMKDLAANLIPLSSTMNISVSNKPFEDKKQEYLTDSMFKSAREIASYYTVWTPEAVLDRSGKLADWAIKTWAY